MLLMLTLLTMCRFCQQNEEDDPSEEFEEYLACSVCGDGGKSSSHHPLHSVLGLSENTKLEMCLNYAGHFVQWYTFQRKCVLADLANVISSENAGMKK
jgi:hypothetical protein